jgi:predicted nucleic acid-binding OB-fold protein
MKSNLLIIAIFALYVFASCGPSAQEKAAADKARTDSIISATRLATEDSIKKATEDSVNISNGMAHLIAKKDLVRDAIPYIDSKVEALKVAQTNSDVQLENIKSFHFLRSVQDKESQIVNQVNINQSINNRLEALETFEKIFKRVLDEMDGIEIKTFNSYSNFESFNNKLDRRIHKIEREIIDECNSNEFIAKFNFDSAIMDDSFIAQVQEYKRLHSSN